MFTTASTFLSEPSIPAVSIVLRPFPPLFTQYRYLRKAKAQVLRESPQECVYDSDQPGSPGLLHRPHIIALLRKLLSDSVDFEKFGSVIFNLNFKIKNFLEQRRPRLKRLTCSHQFKYLG